MTGAKTDEEKEEEMMHPAGPTLEAVAAGDEAGAIAAHLATCAACTGYIETLRAEAIAFRGRTDAATFVEKIAASANAAPVASPAPLSPVARRDTRAARPPRAALAKVVWLGAPMLAAAAAIALWVRSGEPLAPGGPSTEMSAPGMGTHFKGGLSVVAIRERGAGGIQERLSGPFEVAPSDRVRIEVAIDRDEPITAGLLSEDGTWTPLLAPTELAAGTHFSELAARFDDTPTDARLLVGSPDDVSRARETRQFEGVVAWRIRSEPRE
jgi:hypothetical protein